MPMHTDEHRPAILLVHGAWHGPWCWDALAPHLDSRGWRVHTVRLPSSCDEPDGVAGMYDDARAVREAIDAIDGGVTVLAHSYGGIPVTEATAGVAGKVERIVYLSAFQFDVGDSLANQSRGRLSEGESGTIPPNPEPGAYLYNGVAVQDAELAAKQLVAQSLKSFSQPLTNAGWKSIPSSYIVCGEDRAIPAELQRAMAARATDVHELPDAGHSPFLSMPERLAEVVTAAARG
jgi:pimeloyl-ACP methyl ester carboxylesterase